MKTLKLNLAKKLLILDYETKERLQTAWDFYKFKERITEQSDGSKVRGLFNGLEITEEDYRSLIADEDGGISISKHPLAYKISYSRHKNAFVDLIEKEGFYWLENPIEEPDNVIGLGSPFDNLNIEDLNNWKEAESRTLKFPIIFEILEE